MPKIAGAMAGTPGTLRDDRPETALHIQADPDSLSPKEPFVTSSITVLTVPNNASAYLASITLTSFWLQL